jgi:hypothetical protein
LLFFRRWDSVRPLAARDHRLVPEGGLLLKNRIRFILCAILLAVWLAGCGNEAPGALDLRTYPLDDASGVLTRSGVDPDKEITADGGGSLRLTAAEPTTFRLFETGDIDVENARLIYQAKLKTADVDGEVYLEMWCHFPGKGEYFSRALHAPLSGTVDWTTQETPFFLKKGENPDNVKLNLVINGRGTAWIDDMRLIRGSL